MQRRAKKRRTHKPWLALGDASDLLGVTPGTLRRWADIGQVPSFTTPGGHRRFPRAVIEAMIGSQRGSAASGPLAASGDRIAAAYRRPHSRDRSQLPTWVAELTEHERSEFRDRGRSLLKLLLEYLDAPRGRQAQARLEESIAVAREYGRQAAAAGASLSETVQGFLYFRAPFIGGLARQAATRGMATKEATRLLVRAEQAMDRLLAAVMKGFE